MRLVWLFVAGCSYEPRVGEPVDTPIDVEVFDAARDCPTDYVALPGMTSRYRIILDGRKAPEHGDDCNDDLSGRTHLVAIDDAAELDEIERAVTAAGSIDNNRAWVGAVQPRDQTAPTVGWLSITGGEVLVTLWDIGEPNDDGVNEDNGENFGCIERDRDGLLDYFTGDDQGGMCECDGKPPAQAALDAVDTNR